jgi:PAS domain S-box-containing protein
MDTQPRRAAAYHAGVDESLHRRVVENQADFIVEVAADGRILYASPSTCALFGRAAAELAGTPLQHHQHADDSPRADEALRSLARPPHQVVLEHRVQTPRGWRLVSWSLQAVVDASGAVASIVGAGRDVTEQRAHEFRLRQAEKFQAIGQLAGGVAHDFNNQLTGILAGAELLRGAVARDPELREVADMVLSAAEQSARLTRQLLAFARKGALQAVLVDVQRLVADVAEVAGRTIDKRISVRVESSGRAAAVLGDPVQLRSALASLVVNARDAMPDGGQLTLATRVVTLGPDQIAIRELDVAPGRFVSIEIRDTGSGIDPETRAHLFEPFWTTKEQGSGLGLASVFGTVKSHHGAIEVSTRLGAGTVFTLLFPAVQASEEQRGGGPARTAAVPGVRVLVVDDERVVRRALQRILERDGHQVLLAECGQEALDVFARSWKEIDVVILDVMMPDVDGREVLRRMRETNPAVRAILSSGFTAESDPSLTVAGAWLLQKPYTPEQVRAVLAEAMAGTK